MQPTGHHRRNKAPIFVNHTPRFDITASALLQPGPEMLGQTAMAIGAGPLYTNAIMGQAPSAVERENFRKASSTILRSDTITIEESLRTEDVPKVEGTPKVEEPENVSRQDSFSMHYDCTDQAPYCSDSNSTMITQSSLLGMPRQCKSHDLAFFLKTTGPTAPHRRPSRADRPGQVLVRPKNRFKFLRLKRKKSSPPEQQVKPTLFHAILWTDESRHNGVLRDEGGLLHEVHESPLPKGVEQKVSSTGKPYLALQLPTPPADETPVQTKLTEDTDALSPSIVESRVSISFADGGDRGSGMDSWVFNLSENKPRIRVPTPHTKHSGRVFDDDDGTIHIPGSSSTPIRPAASSPPTPEPLSATSMARPYIIDLPEHPAKRSFDIARALSSHPVRETTPLSLPLPKVSSFRGESPAKYRGLEKDDDLKHPAPRRFASHPLLLQRASSIASSFSLKTPADSPGPPPPRSPLRLRRSPGTIENFISSNNEHGASPSPKVAPSISDRADPHFRFSNPKYEEQLVKPTVITECTGPIKRPKSRGRNRNGPLPYPSWKKEREERIRARKLRDRPVPTRTVEAVVSPLSAAPRQRLRKARPQIEIPDLRPVPLASRAASITSSNASCTKVTEDTREPVSAAPSENTPTTIGEKTGYTPISPTTSNGSANVEAMMALSPVMLVAEEVPIPRAKAPAKAAKVAVKDSKMYTPRPRSASIPRSTRRRSKHGVQAPIRSSSPDADAQDDDAPPLPSPPPSIPLPPTPPASGSEKAEKAKARRSAEHKKEVKNLPTGDMVVTGSTAPRRRVPLPHIATQLQAPSRSILRNQPPKASDINSRLEALEKDSEQLRKQNALLSAALNAVLRTNGALNAPVGDRDPESPKVLAAWENRIARRSAASHAASSSNGSALEMYMNTRRGSRHAC